MENLKIMEEFTENSIPDLDTTVLGALEKFVSQGLSPIPMPQFSTPIIGASVNALTTAKILFGTNAIYCDENDVDEVIKNKSHQADGAILFSASGGKHAPILAEKFHQAGLDTYLITCTSNSQAQKIVGEQKTIVTPKNKEPYTYNTSTYLGWVLQKTQESPQEILNFIKEKIDPQIPNNIGEHSGYYLLIPNNATQVGHLFDVKFEELFGTIVPWQTHTFETSKHAKTVIPPQYGIVFGDGELPVHMSEDNIFRVPLPKNTSHATLISVGYYVIGKIQKAKEPYFKQHIKSYIEENKKKGEFANSITLIVE